MERINMITNKTKQKVIKELKEFLLEYETKPSYISAVRKVQGLDKWYRDLDRQNLTEDVIDAMARDYENQTISEGRIYVSNNPNYKE